jgi:hypothetical protein
MSGGNPAIVGNSLKPAEPLVSGSDTRSLKDTADVNELLEDSNVGGLCPV